MTEKKQICLINGKIESSILDMAKPTAIGLLAVILFNFIDIVFISIYGIKELVAITMALPMAMIFNNLSTGMGHGINAILSKEIGRGNRKKSSKIATHGLILSFILATILSLIGYLTVNEFFSIIGAKKDTLSLLKPYMAICYIGFPLFVFQLVASHISRAFGNGNFPSKIMLGSALINLILDPILIFGFWIFPELGLNGAAIASLLVRIIAFVFFIRYLVINKIFVIEKTKFSVIKVYWLKIIKHAYPVIIASLIAPIFVLYITYIISGYGEKAVAAYGIANKIEVLILIGHLSLSVALGPFIGQNIGARKPERVKRGLNYSISLTFAISIIMTLFLAFFIPKISPYLTSDPEIYQIINTYFYIVPISYMADGVFRYCNVTSTVMHKRKIAPLITFIRGFVFVMPLIYLFKNFFEIEGVFLAISVGMLLTGLLSAYTTRTLLRKV